jgi:hypothetical protein
MRDRVQNHVDGFVKSLVLRARRRSRHAGVRVQQALPFERFEKVIFIFFGGQRKRSKRKAALN